MSFGIRHLVSKLDVKEGELCGFWLNSERLESRSGSGARGMNKACGCDVGCWMLDAGCWMLGARFFRVLMHEKLRSPFGTVSTAQKQGCKGGKRQFAITSFYNVRYSKEHLGTV